MIITEDNGQQLLQEVTNDDLTDGVFTVPPEVDIIEEEAFDACSELTVLYVGNDVEIEDRVFKESPVLKKVAFGNNVSIGEYAFQECPALEEAYFSDNVVIDDGAFDECLGLEKASFGDHVEIGRVAFWGCVKLSNVNFGNGVDIGAQAFLGDHALTQVSLGDGTSTRYRSFEGCTHLAQISFGQNSWVDRQSFRHCNDLFEVNVSVSTRYGEYCFVGATGLQFITVNTESDDELEEVKGNIDRVKGNTPAAAQIKVIQKSLFDEVVNFQKNTLTDAFIGPILDTSQMLHAFCTKYPKIPSDCISKILSYDDASSQALKQQLDDFTFPLVREEFELYKQAVNRFLSAQSSPIIEVDASYSQQMVERLSCVAKLKQYMNSIEQRKESKNERVPGFFKENPEVSSDVDTKLETVRKLVAFLEGDSGLLFSNQESEFLRKGLVGSYIERYNITFNLEGGPEHTC